MTKKCLISINCLSPRVEQSVVERQKEKEEYSDFILKASHMIMEHKTLIQVRLLYSFTHLLLLLNCRLGQMRGAESENVLLDDKFSTCSSCRLLFSNTLVKHHK